SDFHMLYILPTPPGQVRSNEVVGLLVFAGLLHIPATWLTAMFVFSHPSAAVLMCTTCLICLSALGLTIPAVLHKHDDDTKVSPPLVYAEDSKKTLPLVNEESSVLY